MKIVDDREAIEKENGIKNRNGKERKDQKWILTTKETPRQ